ncbi:hypothetical protein [Streptomyces sp. NPDC007088]|uniref:hypothetical protein n=1 Tax=Streptomyces sp. NPDC007088 TaxID=3364773 RepID=UPI0036CE7399
MALAGLGFSLRPVAGPAGRGAAARTLARHLFADGLTLREFARRPYRRDRHEPLLTARLAGRGDRYGLPGYGGRTAARVDAASRPGPAVSWTSPPLPPGPWALGPDQSEDRERVSSS